MNNPNNISSVTTILTFLFTSGPGYKLSIPETEHIALAGDVWADFEPEWNMPRSIALTSEESARYTTIMSDVETYCAEAVAKMIMGTVSIDEYDTFFTEAINGMGIDEATAIQQAALDRYMVR